MNPSSDLVNRLWRLCSLLRKDGVTYQQYVTELTIGIGQLTAAGICFEVPVKSTLMLSLATVISTAILSGSEKSPSLHETPTFVLPLQVAKTIIPAGVDNSGHGARWGGTGDPPRAKLFEMTGTILRI